MVVLLFCCGLIIAVVFISVVVLRPRFEGPKLKVVTLLVIVVVSVTAFVILGICLTDIKETLGKLTSYLYATYAHINIKYPHNFTRHEILEQQNAE